MRNDKAGIVIVLLCGLIGPAAGFAQVAAPASGVDSEARATVVPTPAAAQVANELMRLQEDTLLLRAQLKKLDAQAQVAQREQALHQMGGTGVMGEVSLIATQSLGQTTIATLAADGSEFDVRAGDSLPDGSRVAQIRPGQLVLADRDGHRTVLTVSAPVRGGLRNVAANSFGPAGLPPLPTLPLR
jgi:type IV pilus biogenesis protein PilP